MPNLVEMIGQRDIEIAIVNEEYAKLWQVLKDLKEQKTALDQVSVDVLPNGQLSWSVQEAIVASDIPSE